MKKIWHTLFFALFILVLFLFKPRQDIVFGAINESQCIRLFENGQEFKFCIEDKSIYSGTYTLSKDTIFLVYQEYPEVSAINQNLPVKLYINESASRIKSLNDALFSAEIYHDSRPKSDIPAPSNKRILDNQAELISAIRMIGPSVLLQQ